MATLQIYTTPTCPWCKKTKEFLRQHKIQYREKDATDPKYQKEMIKKSGQMGVPVLDIDGQIIVGYDPAAITKAVAKGTNGTKARLAAKTGKRLPLRNKKRG